MSAIYWTKDLFFSSRVTQTARACGLEMSVVPDEPQLLERLRSGDVNLVVLEFGNPQANLPQLLPQIREAAPATVNVIAFGPHVDVTGMATAERAGCDAVYTRGQFNQQMTDILRKHSGSA